MRLVTILAAGLAVALAFGALEGVTPDKAANSKQAADDLARRSVVPDAAHGVFVTVVAKDFSYERAYAKPDTSGLVGYALKAVGRGYSGNIETMVGVDLAGRITGIKIIAHKETPGTGAKIAEVRPAKSVLDVLKPGACNFTPRRVAIDLGGAWKGVVEIKSAELAAEVEKALAAGDTARVVAVAPQAMALVGAPPMPQDQRLVYAIAGAAIKRLREEAMPWWQVQFLGKQRADLVLTKEKSDKNIQAITGATVSSRAVTESVKSAIVQLEQSVGGFKGAK